MRSRTAWTILVLVVILIVIALMRFNLTALQEPGRLETLVSNRATHFLIRRASRQGIAPRPLDTKASIASGGIRYESDCGTCHGRDGHAQTVVGRWIYPRAADLTSEQVQGYSDQELFWIIRNGISFTGMPAFGRVETADHIWDLANYVRTLPGALQNQSRLGSVRLEKQMPEEKE
jgi:mono/diheme cytochrome c family protein